MSYLALYRKFRPQTFDQVKGQDHVVRTLKNQLKNDRIGHAYLFTGTRGTGKTSVAKLFARAINCLDPHDGEPCNECAVCKAALDDSFIDIVEVDAASNTGVDDMRRIIDEVQYTPVNGRYKVYIIDEVHMLSTSAFNAFLKTLEEPPSYVVFILATTEPHKLPITILSRCQRYDFHRISNEVITENLAAITSAEHIAAEEKALQYIAKAGDGSMRDSISLLDKCIAFNPNETLTYENVLSTLGAVDTEVFSGMFRAVYSADVAAVLKLIDKTVNEGRDLARFSEDFLWYLRNLLLINLNSDTSEDVLGISAENMRTLREDAENARPQVLMRYIRTLSELLDTLRYSSSKQILTEVCYIKLAKPQMETDQNSLIDRIRQLEAGAGSAPVRMVNETICSVPEPEVGESVIIGGDEPVWFDIPEPIEPAAARPAPAGGSPARIAAESWADIIDACDGMILKMSLRACTPLAEGDDLLTISSSMDMSLRNVRDKEEDVLATIRKVAGVSVRLNFREEAPREIPDDMLGGINFNIGTEEY